MVEHRFEKFCLVPTRFIVDLTMHSSLHSHTSDLFTVVLIRPGSIDQYMCARLIIWPRRLHWIRAIKYLHIIQVLRRTFLCHCDCDRC